jgi:hypothetical protein
MLMFKKLYIKNLMTLFTGLIFLNMSFFLMEVSALKLHQDKKLLVNIAKLISSSSAEEEKGSVGGSADEDVSAKEVDLIINYTIHANSDHISTLDKKRCAFNAGMPLLGSYEIYSPPPEV